MTLNLVQYAYRNIRLKRQIVTHFELDNQKLISQGKPKNSGLNSGLKKPIILGIIYRPPKDAKYRQFIEEISPILSSFKNENSECIIVGDLNINLLKVNEGEVLGEFFDTLTENSFYPKITLPIIFSNKHGTLIDNLFGKLTDKLINTTSGILIKTFSDHQPCFMFMNDINPKKRKMSL